MNEELRNQINKLSLSEKIILVEEIWDSIASEEQSLDLSELQRKTVSNRSSELSTNPDLGRNWEEIKGEY